MTYQGMTAIADASLIDGPAHRVEAFTETSFLGGVIRWGWQCFTCRAESPGTYAFPDAALAASEGHEYPNGPS